MEKYDHQKIEKKWKEIWDKEKLYKTLENQDKPKFYILDMFPYPSGSGLHVGHPKGYIATDIFARAKIMQGYNVLHPMGWDAFGLPAENYAIQNKIHPRTATEKNIAIFKKQLGLLGFTYDWEREINTTDPEYYKWTQWVFIKMFEKGLAYESYEPINWCSGCQTGLSNEDLEDGKCERCGSEIEKKPMRQWMLKITDYAERLLDDLEKLPDWEESIKEMQRNWIGRSKGVIVKFKVKSLKLKVEEELEVFTTRPDTLFGATFIVIAPEHKLLEKLKSEVKNLDEVEKYIDFVKNKSDLERTDLNKEKTGIKLDGIAAINPVNNEEIPIFVADYVLINYGTGAIMAVPAHDERDWEFAKKYKLSIRKVVLPKPILSIVRSIEDIATGAKETLRIEIECFTGDGELVNSGQFSGMSSGKAREEITNWLEKNKLGKRTINYKLKDWVFSRQRYWGEPIPIVHCEKCGIIAVPEKDLPLKLPDVKNYKPTGTGESPLADIKEWVNTTCPKCGGPAKRETNTMPQWAGSSWYYLRYIDPFNKKMLVDKAKEKYWSPIDFYVGGAEHATRHLIYARFWHKFLYDIGVVNYDEPFTRLQHVGLILAKDGRKMSKRWNNVINPDEIVEKYGADAMRIYEMFMGPFSQPCAWSTNGLIGARRFLERIYKIILNFQFPISKQIQNIKLEKLLHKTIKKVTEDIENFKFNTAISTLMIFINELENEQKISQDIFKNFLILLSPFAPHLTEELYQKIKNQNVKRKKFKSIFHEEWPKYDLKLIKEEKFILVISINGKLRDTINVAIDINEVEAKKLALESEIIKKWLENKEVVKIIFVKNKLVNIVSK